MHLLKKQVLAIAAMAISPMLFAQSPAGGEDGKETNIQAYISLLRKDVKKDKVAVLTEIMDFSPEDASKFWPIYSAYDKELTKLGDEKLALFRRYIESYVTLTDQQATQIVNGLHDVEVRNLALRKKYFGLVSQALGARTAARFLQVEHQLMLILDLQVAASLPIVD